MDSLNQIEIQNIRHIAGHSTTLCDKIEYYKTLTEDQNVTDVLEDLCTACKNLKTEVIDML